MEEFIPNFEDYIEFSKIFKWKHGLCATDCDYFKINSLIETDLPGLFIVGDHVYVGLDPIIDSSVKAASEVINYINKFEGSKK